MTDRIVVGLVVFGCGAVALLIAAGLHLGRRVRVQVGPVAAEVDPA